MKRYIILFPLFFSFGNSYSQISSADTANFNWEKFSNIFRLEVSYQLPDKSFKKSDDGFINKDSVIIKHKLFPSVYEESIIDEETDRFRRNENLISKGNQTIGNINGYFTDSMVSHPIAKKDYRILRFIIPHQYGIITLVAIYPDSLDTKYRQQILTTFSTVKYQEMDN